MFTKIKTYYGILPIQVLLEFFLPDNQQVPPNLHPLSISTKKKMHKLKIFFLLQISCSSKPMNMFLHKFSMIRNVEAFGNSGLWIYISVYTYLLTLNSCCIHDAFVAWESMPACSALSHRGRICPMKRLRPTALSCKLIVCQAKSCKLLHLWVRAISTQHDILQLKLKWPLPAGIKHSSITLILLICIQRRRRNRGC